MMQEHCSRSIKYDIKHDLTKLAVKKIHVTGITQLSSEPGTSFYQLHWTMTLECQDKENPSPLLRRVSGDGKSFPVIPLVKKTPVKLETRRKYYFRIDQQIRDEDYAQYEKGADTVPVEMT